MRVVSLRGCPAPALLGSLPIQGPLPSSEILQGTSNFLKTNELHLVKAFSTESLLTYRSFCHAIALSPSSPVGVEARLWGLCILIPVALARLFVTLMKATGEVPLYSGSRTFLLLFTAPRNLPVFREDAELHQPRDFSVLISRATNPEDTAIVRAGLRACCKGLL